MGPTEDWFNAWKTKSCNPITALNKNVKYANYKNQVETWDKGKRNNIYLRDIQKENRQGDWIKKIEETFLELKKDYIVCKEPLVSGNIIKGSDEGFAGGSEVRNLPPIWEIRIDPWSGKNPTCQGTAKPRWHFSLCPGARVPQLLKSTRPEPLLCSERRATTVRRPTPCNCAPHSNKDPARPELSK